MSPSPAIPQINESKMKLYEMFAQKQMAPPPNLTHPAAAIGNRTNNTPPTTSTPPSKCLLLLSKNTY
jgi:hypothetical protein